MKRSSSILVLANIVPLVGVALLDWSVLDILIVYWTETVIIGAINIKRMAKSQPSHAIAGMISIAPDATIGREDLAKLPTLLFPAIKLAMIAFFVIHYGMFCFGHLIGVLVLFGEPDPSGAISFSLKSFWQPNYWVAVIPIALSHTFSYFNNFVGKVEYRNIGLFALMRRPYGRIMTMQIVVIAGGFLVQWLGSPQLVLVVLVLIKTVVDLRSHVKERSRLAIAEGHEDSVGNKHRIKPEQKTGNAPHNELIGSWQVVSQDPSQEELLRKIMDSGEVDRSILPKLTTTYAIREHEIVISVKGAPVLGGVTRMGYTVEGDHLLLQHRMRGMASRIFKAYRPEYFRFQCRGSQLELISSPIPAFDNQQIRYQLTLVD